MESEKFQKHIIERIQKLEKQTFGGTLEENYGSAREKAEAISEGKAENQFLGQRTRKSALQRVKSFNQNYDEGSVNSLHGDEKIQYEKEKAICMMLIKKYNITEKEVV